MSFTVADVITDARYLLLDEGTTGSVRNSDTKLIRVVNQVLRRMIVLRPDLFAYSTDITCVAGARQSIPADGMRIIDVLGDTATGAQAKEINQDMLDVMHPNWTTDPAGVIQNWIRIARAPTQFYVYPPQTNGTQIQIMYARVPTALTATTNVVPVQDAYQAAVVDGVVWLVESVDSESVESGRAKMFMDSFMAGTTGTLPARTLTDTPTAGQNPQQVL